MWDPTETPAQISPGPFPRLRGREPARHCPPPLHRRLSCSAPGFRGLRSGAGTNTALPPERLRQPSGDGPSGCLETLVKIGSGGTGRLVGEGPSWRGGRGRARGSQNWPPCGERREGETEGGDTRPARTIWNLPLTPLGEHRSRTSEAGPSGFGVQARREGDRTQERRRAGRGGAGSRRALGGPGSPGRLCRELCPRDVSLWLRRSLTCALELKLPESEPYFQN